MDGNTQETRKAGEADPGPNTADLMIEDLGRQVAEKSKEAAYWKAQTMLLGDDVAEMQKELAELREEWADRPERSE